MKLKWVRKVFSDGNHNAFTGLTWFKGQFILAFRSGPRHGRHGEFPDEPGGYQVRMTSADGETWRIQGRTTFRAPPQLPVETKMDARDNYFLKLDDSLRLYSFVAAPFDVGADQFLYPVCSTVQISEDGFNWSAPRITWEGAVLWKPIFWRNQFWCAGYRRAEGLGRVVELYRSADGIRWQRGAVIGPGNESVLWPVADDTLRAIVRSNDISGETRLWQSMSPFTDWKQVAAWPVNIQSPHLETVSGRVFLFGRDVPDPGPAGESKPPACRRTKVWELHDDEAREVLEFPSLGDTGYVGSALRSDGLLLVSYYSQHDRELDQKPESRGGNDKPNDIFMAGVAL